MKSKCLTCLLTGLVAVSITSMALAAVPGYYSTTNPGTTKPPSSPWQSAASGFPMPTSVGQSVWLAKLNDWVSDDQVKSYTVRITGSEPDKYGVASVTGYIEDDGPLHTSDMAAVTGIRDISGSPPSREFTITIKPQPDWEVIQLQRTAALRDSARGIGGTRDTYETEQDSHCATSSSGDDGFDMYNAWFGVDGDSTQTTILAIFADNCDLVDDEDAHSLSASGGPWTAEMIYTDPDGNERTGVSWTSSGSGLYAEDAYSLHIELEDAPVDETFSYYAWDEERDRWVFYSIHEVTQASTKYFWHDGTNGPQAWDDSTINCWYDSAAHTNSTSKATGTDVAIIEADCRLDQDEGCGSFYVDDDVSLYLDDNANPPYGWTLTVNGTGSTSTVDTDAVVHLRDDSSELEFSVSHALAGNGCVQGSHDSATISIASSETLTNSTTIEGALQINGDGSFTNHNVVDANYASDGNETLTLAVAGTLDDTSSADWKATANGAVLKFDSTIGALASLEGDFIIETSAGAVIEVNHALTSTGRFYMDVNGTLNVNEDMVLGSVENHMYVSAGAIVVASSMTLVHY